MSTYRAKVNHDVALGSLTVLSPQPNEAHGGGIQYTDVRRAADGTITKQGAFFPLEWEEITASEFSTILGVFGVSSADSADVTVYVRDVNMSTWVRMNGKAQRPFPGRDVQWNNRPIDLTIMVTDLVAAA